MATLSDDIASLSSMEARQAAEDLLNNAAGDLIGPDAERFEALVTRAKEARQAETRAAADDLLRRHRSGEARTDGGSAAVQAGGDAEGLFVRGAEVPAGARLSPLALSAENIAALESARAEFRNVNLLERAVISTSVAGTATEYAANLLAAPRTLWRASGIPTSTPPLGAKATVPTVTLPAAAALVNEGSAHAEFDDITPDAVTLKRSGAWSDLSTEANISTSIAEISAIHSRIIARDLDLAVVTKVEQTPSGTYEDVDEVLATVAAEAAVDPSACWIFGTPAAVALLAGNATFAAANASDVASFATKYGAASIYTTPAATADTLTVFFPGAYHAFATAMASGITVDPTIGTQRLGQWVMFGLGCTLAGAALTVSGSASP